MAKQYPHFPFVDDYYREKIKLTIERLQTFAKPEGYYLAFSGGKDSVVCYALCKMAGVKFDAHYNNTTIDHPELVKFIRREYPDVVEHRPKRAFLKEMVDRGFPSRQGRWCCEFLKEGGGTGRLVITGVRWEEGKNRRGRRMMEPCIKDRSKIYLHPIIDWNANEVWRFIEEYNIPYCQLYNQGYKRLGCIMCPITSNYKRQQEAAQYPRFVNAYRIAFRKLYQNKKATGKTSVNRWKDGDEMFEWWLYG